MHLPLRSPRAGMEHGGLFLGHELLETHQHGMAGDLRAAAAGDDAGRLAEGAFQSVTETV